MRREHLEHLLRAAGNILREGEIIVGGSQSILGTYDEDALPRYAVMSTEADLLPLDDVDQAKADEIDGVLGEGSLFHETHGFYAQGVDETTSTLPEGWRDRLVRYSNVNTNGVVGLCLDPHDLCVAKLVANRPKDRDFIGALLDANLIQAELLADRPATTRVHQSDVRWRGRFFSPPRSLQPDAPKGPARFERACLPRFVVQLTRALSNPTFEAKRLLVLPSPSLEAGPGRRDSASVDVEVPGRA